MRIYINLFLSFVKIGGLTFGGGLAMLPMLQREVVEKQGWITEVEMVDYFTVSQCLPGIIAVNTAIFIGNKVKGAAGGVCAALGVVFPSLVIITVIAAFLNNFAEMAIVQSAFSGIRACVVALIVNALMKLSKGALYSAFTIVICVTVFALVMFTSVSPIVPVVGAGLIGLFAQWRNGQAGGGAS